MNVRRIDVNGWLPSTRILANSPCESVGNFRRAVRLAQEEIRLRQANPDVVSVVSPVVEETKRLVRFVVQASKRRAEVEFFVPIGVGLIAILALGYGIYQVRKQDVPTAPAGYSRSVGAIATKASTSGII